jgi:hypothetical protein
MVLFYRMYAYVRTMPIVRGLENEAGDGGNIGGGYMRDSFDKIQLSPTVITVVDNDVVLSALLTKPTCR